MGVHEDWKTRDAAAYEELYRGRLKLVPEYEPSEYIIISAGLEKYTLLNEYLRFIVSAEAKAVVLGRKDKVMLDEDLQANPNILFFGEEGHIWTRDFMARTAISNSGQPVFVTMRYYKKRLEAQDQLFKLTDMPEFSQFQHAYTPIRSEWGNLSTTDKHIFAVINSGEDADLDDSEIPLETKEALAEELRALSGLEPIFLEPVSNLMNIETTGHSDMFMLPISASKILVSEVDPLLLAASGKVGLLSNMPEFPLIKERLDRNAKRIADLGYEVIRVPFFIANYLKEGYDHTIAYAPVTNALLINSGTKKKALFPEYMGFQTGREYEDLDKLNELIEKTKATIETAMAAEGYETHWVIADSLLVKGGVVHCTTMHVPKL